MRKNSWLRTSLLFIVCVLGLTVRSASAQTAQPRPPGSGPGVTFTPFMAMGDDYALGGGASFSFRVASRLGLEAEASLGTDAARTGLSLLLDVARLGGFTTYAAVGAGVQRDYIDEEFADVLWPAAIPKKTEFAVGVGGGRRCQSDHAGAIGWTSAGTTRRPNGRRAGGSTTACHCG